MLSRVGARAAWFACVICTTALLAQADEWGAPERAGGRGGGLMRFFASLLGSFGFFKYFRSKGKIEKLKKKYQLGLKQFQTEAARQIQGQLDKYATAIQQEQARLEILHDNIRMWETALFTLPDDDGDKLITPNEFSTYMTSYKKLHPELLDSDLPTFRDMDFNRNGQITFEEWAKFQDEAAARMLMQQQQQQQWRA
ncbi:hypothetical protein JKP88DRAFT_218298 [Tribonema minus]|uniref:EF-hand domain-containing protein n=1 Tax=Tribonema minus TaxID=303371 RepID=A0A835Z5A9_9STRA|nr:hypothetical protein JKP88DRAFT_218298 [Tribonema minus]